MRGETLLILIHKFDFFQEESGTLEDLSTTSIKAVQFD
ncbi:hypothetical protein LEP1GSC103_3727 [Leptospira borgpetersenii serovar Javanica str. UI 09931]|uniref:Uncharacterized protein n=5 Tax=Leptospira borgpetersenii TaxID=174 RepID=M3GYB5_LEPBO|nr:hypothetical protein LBBP_00888 [Leptospira borgpetersenii serovar Ballum]EKP15253.1 hypothetical protein LEP1GSC128_1959 [Leptospira borgpetersenii str. 200801926]EKQ93089.1 hypothetical protein LEP1GSC101_3865 [Leptospira borgpetersenii str. UI 09149]EKQ98677.1 hypothetical protein LEP1GSC121_3387 [Leptospira borgpetersenii serovar Castellonis str. 200801910]EMF99838.1 hypothetical protein LEP1GSC123_3600 [Leptospira borgpetersenii str. 200701203]EMK09378.1 hypothetical protein LEP1GSC066